MSDLIDRQAAIDALMEFDKKLRKINWYQYPYTEHECRGVDKAIVKIENLPSAQPEKRTEERTETHACDCIERQAAIDELYKMLHDCFWADDEELDAVITTLNDLPSAQPEMIREIRKWINSGNRGNADYFIVEKIEEIINKYE